MKDGVTVKLLISQILSLLERGDLSNLLFSDDVSYDAGTGGPLSSMTVQEAIDELAASYLSTLPQAFSLPQRTQAITNLGLGYTLKSITRITSSQTYTVPADVRALLVRAVGGGGAGGSANTPSGNANAGGGGAAGAYGEIFISSPAASYVATIGAGGAPGGVAQDGGNGGTTSFGSVLELGGGGGGSVGSLTTAGFAGRGVPGAVITGGDFSYEGQDGFYGVRIDASMRIAGKGGSGPFGTGGRDGATAGGATAVGNAGVGYGSGGAGGLGNTTTQTIGGAGAPGYIEVWEFV